MKKTVIFIGVTLAVMALALAVPAQEKGPGFLWDGTHWAKSSQDGKLGYIWGLSNLADEEVAGAAKVGKVPCLALVVQQEMKARTALQLLQEVDRFYQDNPGLMNAKVLEVLLRNVRPLWPPEAKGQEKKK